MENLNDTWSNKYHALDHKYNEMQREVTITFHG